MSIKNLLRFSVCIFLTIQFSSDLTFGQELHLNEIMSSNATVHSDEDGDFEDWIEIYNSGADSVNLTGFGLSDDYNRPFRWVFPDTTIAPEEYMIVWASGKNRLMPGNELHTNYGISSDGEEVLLTEPGGTRLDELSPVEIPGNISIGRQPDGVGDLIFFSEPTPGTSNNTEGYSEVLEPPVFSHSAGFYSQDIEVELSHPDPDVQIYYTVDGSNPSRDSKLYEDEISLSDRSEDPNLLSVIPSAVGSRWRIPAGNLRKGNTIRVKAIKDGALSSVQTKTFFIFQTGSEIYNLPVISIVTDSLNLFDNETGIYIPGVNHVEGNEGTGNYAQRGIEWERPSSIEFFESDGQPAFEQNIGIRIHGGWTRRFQLKSLRLYARSSYGENRFNHKIFDEIEDESFNRLILRGSGNEFGQTMFMDAAAQSLIRHFNVDTQAYRPAVVFINGEFWGIHNLRERYDKHYLERVYGADPDNIDLLTGRNSVKEGENRHYNRMIEYITANDLSTTEHFDTVATKMDIDNFLDYYSAQIYYGNTDWPQNNIDFWRSRNEYNPGAPKGHDGRWRWMLYDVDRSLGFSTKASFDMLEWVLSEKNLRNDQEWPNLIFSNLLENQVFHEQLVNRISDHLNTAFTPERVSHVIDSLKTPLEPVIDEHIERWPNHGSSERWEGLVENMLTYADERPGYLRQHMMDHFEIGEETELTADVSDKTEGFIRVNTTDIRSLTPGVKQNPYPWSGIYFSEVPVTLSAQARDGYVFTHWSASADLPEDLNPDSPEIKLLPEPDNTYTAHFTEAEEEKEAEVIHYWVFTSGLPNNTPLKQVSPVYSENEGALLEYEAAIAAYPPAEGTAGILDRVNDPTELNYLPDIFGDVSYEDSGMRGIRARNPSIVDDRESSLIFNLPATGYEPTVFTFAAVRTGSGQRQLNVEYSTEPDSITSWSSEGLEQSQFIMNEDYKEITIGLDDIESAVNNPDFKIRIRFGGDEEIRKGESGNVRFNNISLSGIAGDFEEPDDAEDFVHYWVFDDNLPNDTPLEFINSTYSSVEGGKIEFKAAFSGYPPEEGTEGILDRVNDPTMINYFPSGNFDRSYDDSEMRGIRTRNPSLTNSDESTVIFHMPTDGVGDLNFSFAANRTSSGQENLLFDYSTGLNQDNWTDSGLAITETELFENYRKLVIPLDSIEEIENNPEFRFRIRFGGDEDIRRGTSGNVRFNNITLRGTEKEFVSTEMNSEVPDEVSLEQNYPNPFNPSTVIKYTLPESIDVTLAVYDMIGRRIATLVDSRQNAGAHHVSFDASNISSGVYFYRLTAGNEMRIRKMTLIK